MVEELQVLRRPVQVGEFEPDLDSPEVVVEEVVVEVERGHGQTDEVRQPSLGFYEGQVPAQGPLVVDDDPVEGDEGLAGPDLLEVLHLAPGPSPGQDTLGGGEDELG